MDADPLNADCRSCPGRVICRCLQVTEGALLRVLGDGAACSLREIRQRTGAGDGCTACHRLLRQFLDRRGELAATQPSSSASPI